MMGPGSLILFFAIACAVIATGAYLSVSAVREMNEALRKIRVRLGGRLQEGGLFDEPGLDFTLGGCPAYLRAGRRDRMSMPYLRVAVDLRNRTSGRFSIAPITFHRAFLKRYGTPYVDVGDRDFDRDYAVQSEPTSIAARVFAPSRRQEAIASVLRLKAYENPSIELDETYLVVQVRQYDAEDELLTALVKTAEDMLGYLLESAPLPGVKLEDVRVLSGGECPVCGSAMEEGVIRCEACRTPHHRECWQYMGRCTTYACRGRRFVA